MEQKIKAKLEYVNKLYLEQFSKVKVTEAKLKREEDDLIRLESEINTLHSILTEYEKESKIKEKPVKQEKDE